MSSWTGTVRLPRCATSQAIVGKQQYLFIHLHGPFGVPRPVQCLGPRREHLCSCGIALHRQATRLGQRLSMLAQPHQRLHEINSQGARVLCGTFQVWIKHLRSCSPHQSQRSDPTKVEPVQQGCFAAAPQEKAPHVTSHPACFCSVRTAGCSVPNLATMPEQAR